MVQIRLNLDETSIGNLPDYFVYIYEKDWINSRQISFSFSKVINYDYNPAKSEKPPKIIQTINNPDKIIDDLLQLLLTYEVENFSLNGTIVPSFLMNIFWQELNPNYISGEEQDPISIICAANQGIFGCVDFKGKTYPCGYELASDWGIFHPKTNLKTELINQFNSVEHLLDKFERKPCIDCKFIFVCSRRQCEFLLMDDYDEKEKYCTEFYQSFQSFLNFYG